MYQIRGPRRGVHSTQRGQQAPGTIAPSPTEGQGPSQPRGQGAALSMLSTAMAQGLQRGQRRRGPRRRGQRGQGISDVSQDLTQAAMNPQRGPGGGR